ncbi:MAG: hypothetical protein ACKESB_03555 [Candidatus Hodgkinia cicadicola]
MTGNLWFLAQAASAADPPLSTWGVFPPNSCGKSIKFAKRFWDLDEEGGGGEGAAAEGREGANGGSLLSSVEAGWSYFQLLNLDGEISKTRRSELNAAVADFIIQLAVRPLSYLNRYVDSVKYAMRTDFQIRRCKR